ncbi:MAG TPA: hypothetical protein PKW55_06435 [Spirochaetota bacterium]|nr:hypothetical protein [Spirochaetota bacterium]HOM38521.1 hypothetical protein [Spirochaetota bacterium]HPQ49061.1 hypothetical protein [Spirochaetota bacterium]
MKKVFIIYFLFFSQFLFSNWEYDEQNKQLLYNGQPFPTYSPVLTPIGLYYFEKFSSNVYYAYGWFKKKPDKESFDKITPDKNSDEQGWFIYDGNLDYPSIDGWLYFPEKRLFVKIDVFFRFYNLIENYYFNIQKLEKYIYNKVYKKLYRVETAYLSKKTDYVRLETEDFIIINSKLSGIIGPKYIFILYPYFKKMKEYYSIRLKYYSDNKLVKIELIKCIQ